MPYLKRKIFNMSLILYLTCFLSLNIPVIPQARAELKTNNKIKVAILDFKGNNVSATDAAIITSQFHDELFNTGNFQILDKALVTEILTKFNYEAAGICDLECAVNIGENLDTDKVITGEVSRLGELYIINVRMIDVDSASLEVTEVLREKCNLEDLPFLIAKLTDNFVDKIMGEEKLKGKLLIKTVPDGVEVKIDGRSLGISPFELIELDIGKYTFEASKEGYKNKLITAEIENAKTREISFELESEYGKLALQINPEGSEVLIDGKSVGFSPVDDLEYPVGEYTVEVKKAGHETQSKKVVLKSGEITNAIFTLEPVKVVASPVTEKPEEEEGGGTIWLILGGVAVVGVVAAILLSGSDEEPAQTTGTLVINNNLSFSVQVNIDGTLRGTIAGNTSVNYNLTAGTHTVKLTSIDTSGTLLGSSSEVITSSKPVVSDSTRPGSRIRTTRSIRTDAAKSSRTINNLKAYSKTYAVNITGGQTTTINHGSDWDNGDLSVTSNPSGASIGLDGTDTGRTTPSRIDEVSPGSHTVTCKKPGYSDGSKTVTVTAGRTESVHIILTGQSGSLYVTSNPTGAGIWLDNASTSKTTPAQIDGVTAGQHTVTCKKTGYSDVSKVVTVESGQKTNVHIDMTQQTGSISVTSNPTGASIWLDGADTGKVTPDTLTGIVTGSHTVTCKMTGYDDVSKIVQVNAGKTTNVSVDLNQKTGNIDVSSNPTAAQIWLDGSNTGQVTPSILSGIAVGSHTINCKKTGYDDASQTVDVLEDQTVSVNLTLVQQTGSISVTSDPSVAEIWLDGSNTGQVTPATLTGITVGSHTVTCKKPGYNDGSKMVTVTASTTESVHIILTPVSTCSADLRADSITGPSSGHAGGSIDVNINYTNNGPDGSDVMTYYYLSTDTAYDQNDFLLDTYGPFALIGSGVSRVQNGVPVDIPSNAPIGTWYLLYIVKSGNCGCTDPDNSNNSTYIYPFNIN